MRYGVVSTAPVSASSCRAVAAVPDLWVVLVVTDAGVFVVCWADAEAFGTK